MSLLDKIFAAKELTRELIHDHPEITDIWFEFDNQSMKELRAADKKFNKESELEFNESRKKMRLLVADSTTYDGDNSTIFCYSKKIKIKNHKVIKDAYKNI